MVGAEIPLILSLSILGVEQVTPPHPHSTVTATVLQH